MYLTEEQIKQLYIVKLPQKTPDGFDVYANGYLGGSEHNVCFTGESINPRFARLFQAAPAMYQTMYAQLQSMLQFEKALNGVGAKAIAADVSNMCEALRIAMAMATEGVEEVHKRVLALQTLQRAQPTGKVN